MIFHRKKAASKVAFLFLPFTFYKPPLQKLTEE